MTSAPSPARAFVGALARLGPERAHAALDAMLDELSVVELAALAHDWRDFWARPAQIIDSAGPWRSHGLLTGRGFGKTRTISEFVQEEVAAERARRIALIAQNEDQTLAVMVHGPSGLLATSPPWFKAHFEGGRVVWPNGAQAFVYTPEVPGELRGPEHDLGWGSEIVAWPAATADEALSNLRLGLRLGYGRFVWDSTPKRRSPLVRFLLKRAEADPLIHRVTRGGSRENADNLTRGMLDELEREIGGTQRGREELEGIFLEDEEGALFREGWFATTRRQLPSQLARRILAIDPATSDRAGTDRTGIVELGLGFDAQVYVIADLTRRASWEEWARLVVDRYVTGRCDCIVVERNKVGGAPVAILRAEAHTRGMRAEVVQLEAPTRHVPGVIYAKEVFARGAKELRAEPVTPLYEKGRVSHVIGADLGELETVMTTWVPGPGARSPDALDALVHGVSELAGLWRARRDPRAGMAGLDQVTKAVTEATRPQGAPLTGLAGALPRAEWGSRI